MQFGTVLVVDDEPDVRVLLRRCLESDGYAVVETDDERGVRDALVAQNIDLITLDLHLCNGNGLDIAKNIRQLSDVPIIMITGQNDVIDRVVGLELGADDYIIKPFHVREVIARVRSVLRRFGNPQDPSVGAQPVNSSDGRTIHFDDMTAQLDNFELFGRDGEPISLTSGDFQLLAVFLQKPKRMLSRDRIMDLLNGAEWAPLDRTIDNQVARLRKKIEHDPTAPVLIKTVRGLGYMLATDVNTV